MGGVGGLARRLCFGSDKVCGRVREGGTEGEVTLMDWQWEGKRESSWVYLVHAGHRLEAGTLRALSACRRT